MKLQPLRLESQAHITDAMPACGGQGNPENLCGIYSGGNEAATNLPYLYEKQRHADVVRID